MACLRGGNGIYNTVSVYKAVGPLSSRPTLCPSPLLSPARSIASQLPLSYITPSRPSLPSPMPSYTITEPHPTARNYIHSGRGGAGNTFKAPKTSNPRTATGPASHFEHGLPQTAARFSSGRGGAGNIHLTSEKAPYSFDDELERQQSRERDMRSGAAYHVGRGGAGNCTSAISATAGRKDSTGSVESGSSRSGFLGRLSHSIGRV